MLTEKKKAQPKSWEFCFIQPTSFMKPIRQPLRYFWVTDPKRQGRSQIYRNFWKSTNLVVRTSKRLLLMLMNLALFYRWEDARVWAHWNHFLGMNLTYLDLGSASCFSSSWIPSRCCFVGVCVCGGGVDAVAHGLMATVSFVCWYGHWCVSYILAVGVYSCIPVTSIKKLKFCE